MWNMSNTSQRTRRTIDVVGVALCLALTALLYVMSVHPMLEYRQEQREMQAQAAAERDEVVSLTAALTEIRQQYVTIQREVSDHALRLEPLSALNRRVAILSSMARQTGLEVESVRPGRPSASEHYRIVPVRMAGEGSFRAVSAFLDELYEQTPDVGVWSLQLDRRGDDGGQAVAHFELNLTWYASPGE